MPNTNDPQPLSPKDLANQLFEGALLQVKSNYREAARQVIVFLKEALVYAVMSTAGDDVARKALLRGVGESIVALTEPPPPSVAGQ